MVDSDGETNVFTEGVKEHKQKKIPLNTGVYVDLVMLDGIFFRCELLDNGTYPPTRLKDISKDFGITIITMATSSSSSPSPQQEEWQWIFHGNIVVPTGNPFHSPPIDQSDAHTLWLGPGLKLCLNHVLIVNHDGIIVHFRYDKDISKYTHLPSFVQLSDHEFLCPGFIDLHIHAPQFAYTGTGERARHSEFQRYRRVSNHAEVSH